MAGRDVPPGSTHYLPYFFSAAGFLSPPAAVFGTEATGTMMCAYLVPFHITQGPPLCGSVGSASSCDGSGTTTITCGGLTIQLLFGAGAMANGSVLLAPLSPFS